jgi:hypothetical protein
MKIRRSELYRLRVILEAMPKGPYAKFNYALGKNLRKIKEEIRDLEDAVTPDEKMQQYEKERIAINEECAKKEGGSPAMIPQPDGTRRYQVDEAKQELFNKKMELLRKKYKPTLDLQEKKIQGYNQLLRELVEIDFHQINKDDVPDDLSPSDWEAIIDWIVESQKNPKGK